MNSNVGAILRRANRRLIAISIQSGEIGNRRYADGSESIGEHKIVLPLAS